LGADETTLAIAGNKATASKRISIEGGAFRKFVNGKEVAVIEDRFLNVIIVNAAPHFSRTYYKDPYKKGVAVSPVCWSSDGEKPSDDAKVAQSTTCSSCAHSVKGSGDNGIGSACRRSWRAAVVMPNDPSGDVMQIIIPDKSIWGNEEAGKWPWKAYVKMLANNNISVGHVITKMQFDISQSAPRLLFSPSGVIDIDDLPVLKEQGASAAALAAVQLTAYHTDSVSQTEVESPTEAPAAYSASKEPKLRESPSAPVAAGSDDMAEKIRKWANKGKGV
jgi:hypothetical protein